MNDESKREETRRHILLYPKIYSKKDGPQIGWLGDLSETGIMIISTEPFESGSRKKFFLELPRTGRYLLEYAELEIQFLWARKDKNPRYYTNGGVITDVSEQSKCELETLISVFGLADNRELKDYTDFRSGSD